jgi:hypothetical protein
MSRIYSPLDRRPKPQKAPQTFAASGVDQTFLKHCLRPRLPQKKRDRFDAALRELDRIGEGGKP